MVFLWMFYEYKKQHRQRCCFSVLLGVSSLPFKQNHCYDGCTDECRDRVDWQSTLETGHAGNDAAGKSKSRTGEHGGRHEHSVVAGAPYRAAEMRHGKPEEHYRTAIGGDDCHEYTAATDYHKTRAPYVKTEVAGIVFAQK